MLQSDTNVLGSRMTVVWSYVTDKNEGGSEGGGEGR